MSDAKKNQDFNSPDLDRTANDFIEFLKDPKNKSVLKDFLIEHYQKLEAERVSQLKARIEHEHVVDSQRTKDYHQPGNIEPLVSQDLGMSEVEKAFARGITLTKRNLTRSVEDRVEEINRLLAGIGGFSSQLKSCFARSTVVFLEQEDPKYSFRDRLIFSIHLPNFELKRPLTPTDKTPGGRDKKEDNGRSPVQASWDDAVNALARIIETSGLKPKYCKNDRNYGHFVMKQDLRSNTNLPDEYFSLTLDFNTKDRIHEMCQSYNKIVTKYESQIAKLTKSVSKWPADSTSTSYLKKKKKFQAILQERDYFVGTVPDPNNLDEGLLFLIEVSTQKDYHIVKDRMQSIMTKFILHLSSIAEKEADFDPDLEYELWKSGQQNKPVRGKGAETKKEASRKSSDSLEVLAESEIEGIPEYSVEENALKPIEKKKKNAA